MIPGLTPLPPGARAPNVVIDVDGTPLDLATALPRGGAWLFFLPLAGAPVCREDARALAAATDELGAADRPLFVASVDHAAHLRRFLDELGGTRLRAISDPALELARAYGVAWSQGFAARASFLIGADGVIRASAIHPIAWPRPLADLKSWMARAAPESRGSPAAPAPRA